MPKMISSSQNIEIDLLKRVNLTRENSILHWTKNNGESMKKCHVVVKSGNQEMFHNFQLMVYLWDKK